MKEWVISLSYFITGDTPSYGNLLKPKIIPYKSIARGDSCNLYVISMCNHIGTHVDAPAHFVKGGKRILDYFPNDLIFHMPMLVNIPKGPGEWIEEEDIKNMKIKNADCLLIRTGFAKFRNKEIYMTHNPGISPEAIFLLRKNIRTLRCVGIDSISVGSFQNRARGRRSHYTAFEKRRGLSEPLLLIEDMNLEPLKQNNMVKIKKIIVVPWLISDVDSAPCTVFAVIQSKNSKE